VTTISEVEVLDFQSFCRSPKTGKYVPGLFRDPQHREKVPVNVDSNGYYFQFSRSAADTDEAVMEKAHKLANRDTPIELGKRYKLSERFTIIFS
jgi:hypothetical protein